jgi:hypothetical protein
MPTKANNTKASASTNGKQVVNVHVHVGDKEGRKKKPKKKTRKAAKASSGGASLGAPSLPPAIHTNYGVPPARYPFFQSVIHGQSPYPDAPVPPYFQSALTNQQASLDQIRQDLDHRFGNLNATIAALGAGNDDGDAMSAVSAVRHVHAAQQTVDEQLQHVAGVIPGPSIIPGPQQLPQVDGDIELDDAGAAPASVADVQGLLDEVRRERLAADQRAAVLAAGQRQLAASAAASTSGLQQQIAGAVSSVRAIAQPAGANPDHPMHQVPPGAAYGDRPRPNYPRYRVEVPPGNEIVPIVGRPRAAMQRGMQPQMHVNPQFEAYLQGQRHAFNALAGGAIPRVGMPPQALPPPANMQMVLRDDEGRRRLVRRRLDA